MSTHANRVRPPMKHLDAGGCRALTVCVSPAGQARCGVCEPIEDARKAGSVKSRPVLDRTSPLSDPTDARQEGLAAG